jgi:hypothetical protein
VIPTIRGRYVGVRYRCRAIVQLLRPQTTTQSKVIQRLAGGTGTSPVVLEAETEVYVLPSAADNADIPQPTDITVLLEDTSKQVRSLEFDDFEYVKSEFNLQEIQYAHSCMVDQHGVVLSARMLFSTGWADSSFFALSFNTKCGQLIRVCHDGITSERIDRIADPDRFVFIHITIFFLLFPTHSIITSAI